MAGIFEQVDDDGCSVESFEDVGTKTTSAQYEEPTEPIEEHVPDVLYVVQYRNVNGRIIDTRKSDKPLNVSQEGGEEKNSVDKRPVIEILTQVTAMMAPRCPPQVGWRPGNYPPPPNPPDGIRIAPPPGCQPDLSDNRNFKVDKVETTDMIIHSEHLKSALNAIIGYYPGVDFIGGRVTVEAPYHVLIHFRKELEMYKFNQPGCHDEEYAATTSQHIDVLLSFLKTTFGEKIEAEENRWNMDVPLATFDLLWLLLKPGEIIYTKEDNHWFPSVVSGLGPIHRGANGVKAAYLVHHWNIEYMNGRMQRRLASTTINPFSGEQTIQSLSVIPARFIPGGAKAAAERQIRLGREYWELSKTASHKEYEGTVIDKDGNNLGKIQGRVIVDCEGHARSRDGGGPPRAARPHRGPRQGPPPPHIVNVVDQLPQIVPRCTCQACQKLGAATAPSLYAGFDNLDPNKDAPPDNDLYFYVLADTISAFILGDRRWGFVEIEHLRDVRFDREAFKYLVLDDEIKLTVKALIGKFANADGKVSPWPSDFVKNKGEGRIFLLHGSPGVGKTCTAECVAELTRRPLLSLTSGDISTSGSTSSVERNLDYFLKLGERYGALVLLDEADVYLEERRTRDLHRNGLVSIFLRALEYYRGVLFLTTNRVEAFDTAFTSRIHVALHYKRLTDDDRQRIWTHNFERLERDSNGKAFVPLSARTFCYESDDVKTLRWNGREIRNALQTAVALAESEALDDGVETVTVAEKHLRAVVKMSRGFRDYLRKRRGWDEQDEEEDDSDVDDNVSSSSGESL